MHLGTAWNLLALLLLLIILYLLYNPQPIANGLLKVYGGSNSPLEEVDETDINQYAYYTRKARKKSDVRRALLVVPGGAFIRTLTDFTPFNANCFDALDIVITTYPVRFKHRVRDAIEHVGTVIATLQKKYDKLTILGYSAGTYLSLQNLQAMNYDGAVVDSFIGISGFYGRKYLKDPLLWCIDWMYGDNPSCQPVNVKTWLSHSSDDILKVSSQAFAKECGTLSKEYNGGHLLLYDLKRNKQLMLDIANFIGKL